MVCSPASPVWRHPHGLSGSPDQSWEPVPWGGHDLTSFLEYVGELCTCWRGARGGGNGCHYWHCAAHATVFAVCFVTVPAVSVIVMASNQPFSTAQHPHETIIHDHSCITSSFVTKTSIFLPPSCYLLGASCLSGISSAPSPSDEGLIGSTE